MQTEIPSSSVAAASSGLGAAPQQPGGLHMQPYCADGAGFAGFDFFKYTEQRDPKAKDIREKAKECQKDEAQLQ